MCYRFHLEPGEFAHLVGSSLSTQQQRVRNDVLLQSCTPSKLLHCTESSVGAPLEPLGFPLASQWDLGCLCVPLASCMIHHGLNGVLSPACKVKFARSPLRRLQSEGLASSVLYHALNKAGCYSLDYLVRLTAGLQSLYTANHSSMIWVARCEGSTIPADDSQQIIWCLGLCSLISYAPFTLFSVGFMSQKCRVHQKWSIRQIPLLSM